MTQPRLLDGEIPISGPGIDDYSDEVLSEAEAEALLAEDEAYARQARMAARLEDFESKAFNPNEPRDPATGRWIDMPGAPGAHGADNRSVQRALFGTGLGDAKNRKAMKAKIVSDVSAQIESTPELEDWISQQIEEGGRFLYPAEEGDQRKQVITRAVDGILGGWAGSASTLPRSQALQKIAANYLGLDYDPGQGKASDVAARIRRTLDETLTREGPLLRAVVAAVYANTQKRLSELGISEITVFRGEKGGSGDFNPLSSWTTSHKEAEKFATGKAWLNPGARREGEEAVHAITVPASRVWSTAATGPGALVEAEVILIGGANDQIATQRLDESKVFNPNELRDLAGRWTRSGSSGDLLKHMVREGGFTFDVHTGKHESSGYVVAVTGHSLILKPHEFTKARLADYLTEKMPVLAANKHLRLGGWYDREHDEVVLDLVELHDDREQAIRLAQERDEQAIFHLDTGDEIATGGTGGRKQHDAGAEPSGGAGPPAGGLGEPDPRGAGSLVAGLHRQGDGAEAGVKDFDPRELRDLLGRWTRAGGSTGGDVPRFSLVTPEPVTGIRRSSRHVTVARNASELLGAHPFSRTPDIAGDEEWQRLERERLKYEGQAREYQRGISKNEVIPSHLDRPRQGVPLGSEDDTGGRHLTAEEYAQERDKRLVLAKQAAERRDYREMQIRDANPIEIDGNNRDGLGPQAQQHLDALLHTGRVIEKEAQRRAAVRQKETGVDAESLASAERDLSNAYQEVNIRRIDAIDADTERALAVIGGSMKDNTTDVYVAREEAMRNFEKNHPDIAADYRAAEEASTEAMKHSRRAERARKELLSQARLEVLSEIRPMGGVTPSLTVESTSEPGYEVKSVARLQVGDVLKGSKPGTHMEITGIVGVAPTTMNFIMRNDEGVEHGIQLQKSWIASVKRPEGQPDHPTKEDLAAIEGLREAAAFYPKDWLDASNWLGDVKMIVTDRGYYDAEDERIALSGVLKPGEALRTATHELGHRMERANPYVMRAEWAYYLSRTSTPHKYGGVERTGGNALQRVPGYPAHEVSRPDTFPDPYTGKEYGKGGPEEPYEILTTSMESLFGHSPYADQGLTEFTLGVLATL